MSAIKVTINGNTFEMVFNLKVFRVLGKQWGLSDLPATMQRVALIENLSTGSFDSYDVLFDILYQAIACNRENPAIDREDIEELDTNQLIALAGQMVSGISEAFPQEEQADENAKKPKAPKQDPKALMS